MKRAFSLVILLSAMTVVSPAQNRHLPRDSQKLIERAQAFWAALVVGKRIEALNFVAPNKKNLFLSGSPVPIIRAEVVALDLTDRPDQAQVRVSLETLNKEAVGSRNGWEITDVWVWTQGNWFLDLRDAPESVFPHMNSGAKSDTAEVEKKIDRNFQILRNPVDLGRLIQGEKLTFEIPIKYTGDVPVSVESEIENPLADIDAESARNVTSSTTQLNLIVSTEAWDGPFDLPLPIAIRNGAATVKRRLVIRGTVFAPLTFRLDAPAGKLEPNQSVSLFIKNNTLEEATILRINTQGSFEIVRSFEKNPANEDIKLFPNKETEIVLKLKPDGVPDGLDLQLTAPIEGHALFTYRFPASTR